MLEFPALSPCLAGPVRRGCLKIRRWSRLSTGVRVQKNPSSGSGLSAAFSPDRPAESRPPLDSVLLCDSVLSAFAKYAQTPVRSRPGGRDLLGASESLWHFAAPDGMMKKK